MGLSGACAGEIGLECWRPCDPKMGSAIGTASDKRLLLGPEVVGLSARRLLH